MSVHITVVSGFLNSGKTTLINSLLKINSFGRQSVFIENDYGALTMDQAFFDAHGVTFKDLNTGCICCSNASDFVKSVAELIAQHQPEHIIIEPSGTGKLSDILNLLRSEDLRRQCDVAAITAITAVDVCKFQHNDRFVTEYFWDQIRNGDTLVLNKTCRISKEALLEMEHTIRMHHFSGRMLRDCDPAYLDFLRDQISSNIMMHSVPIHTRFQRVSSTSAKRQLHGFQLQTG